MNPETVIVVVSTLAALVMNIVLDTYTDIQMLFRWAIAVMFGMFITICVSRWLRKRRGRDAHGQRTPAP